jgi:hypothetical protein
MGEMSSLDAIEQQIREQAESDAFRVTQHAQQEMAEEDFDLDDVLQALRSARLLEHYPDHRRGSCCLIYGYTDRGRPVHVVCTTAQPLLILITVYEPKPPKWVTPTKRGNRP